MRIQFVRVPSEGSFGATDKVLMCVSEVEGKADPLKLGERLEGLRASLGVSGVLVTDEVVRFEPAQPEPDMDCDTRPEDVYQCTRMGGYFTPVPSGAHGPCKHIACCLDHCKCEHSDA